MENQKRICVAICFGSSNHFTGLKLWFVGNFNSNIGKREHSWVWGWGIRYPCDWRARSLGSKRPSEIYSRRDVLLDHISGYVGKTLVFEK